MEKPRILLLTHGGWGMGLVQSAKMILGTIDCVDEIPLLPEMTFAEYYEKVRSYIESSSKNILIMTDVFGGTTTNVGAKLGKDENIKVISGLNAPLLIEACSQIMFNDQLEFEKILQNGKDSIKDVVAEVLKSIQSKEG